MIKGDEVMALFWGFDQKWSESSMSSNRYWTEVGMSLFWFL